VTCDGLTSHSGGVQILLAILCYSNRDKPWKHEPVLASRLHFSFKVVWPSIRIKEITSLGIEHLNKKRNRFFSGSCYLGAAVAQNKHITRNKLKLPWENEIISKNFLLLPNLLK